MKSGFFYCPAFLLVISEPRVVARPFYHYTHQQVHKLKDFSLSVPLSAHSFIMAQRLCKLSAISR